MRRHVYKGGKLQKGKIQTSLVTKRAFLFSGDRGHPLSGKNGHGDKAWEGNYYLFQRFFCNTWIQVQGEK